MKKKLVEYPLTKITRCEDYNREWVHAEPLRYYLAQEKSDGRWSVIDRSTDFAVTPPFKSKGFAVSHFLRQTRKKQNAQQVARAK